MGAQKLGTNVILHAATGSGKTGIAAGPHLLPSSAGKVTLMVSPLLSLHAEQVSTFQTEFNLKATAINSSNGGCTKENLEKIVAGEWQIVMLSPEMLLSRRFIDGVLRKPAFGSRCLSVFIDEAHCVSNWGAAFRKKYASIGLIRAFLPRTTPFIADLLAKLQFDPTNYLFCTIGNDRPNVSQVIRAMEHPANSYRDSDFIVPSTMTKPVHIKKAFVYTDDIKEGGKLTDYLNGRVAEPYRDRGLVRPYNATMTMEYRADLMRLFKAGVYDHQKPVKATRQKGIRKGPPLDSVRQALFTWRRNIKKMHFPGAMFAPHAILDDATCETLASIGPVNEISTLQQLLQSSWSRWEEFGLAKKRPQQHLKTSPSHSGPTRAPSGIDPLKRLSWFPELPSPEKRPHPTQNTPSDVAAATPKTSWTSQSQRLRHRRIGTGTCDSSPASSTHLPWIYDTIHAGSVPPRQIPVILASHLFLSQHRRGFPHKTRNITHTRHLSRSEPRLRPPPSSTAGHGAYPYPSLSMFASAPPHHSTPGHTFTGNPSTSSPIFHVYTGVAQTKLDKAKDIRLRVHSHIATQIGMTPSELLNPAQLGRDYSYVFAVTSFVPVVSAIALALFASFLAVAGLLTTLFALGLSLLVVLSATLVFSAAATILVSNIPRFGGLPEQTRDGAATEPADNLTGFGRRRSPMRRAFTAFGTASRRRVSTGAPVSSSPFSSSSATPSPESSFPVLSGTTPSTQSSRLHTHAAPSQVGLVAPHIPLPRVCRCSPFKIVRLVLGVVLELGVEARKATLAAVVGFLRETLESLEKMRDTPTAEPSASTETPATEAAEDKTVPSVVPPGQAAGATGVSTTDGVSSEVKARNVAGAAHADSIAATGSN
ncbi:hypothetical protein B0H14DRAFT_3675066 [Mycena olivaceomarginata]|nr:hypothetical protein B0H14DRAFT_3675066 [Mycena olivaceomarginata]